MMDVAEQARLFMQQTHRGVDDLISQLQQALRDAELEKQRYELLCNEVKQRQDHFRESASTLSHTNPLSSSLSSSVTFLVSEKRFVLPRSYVVNCPDSILAALVNGNTSCPVDMSESGDILLQNRSRDAFEVIVKYLEYRFHRDQQYRSNDPVVHRAFSSQMHRLFSTLSPAELPVVRDESIFYALDELAELAYRHEVCTFLCDSSFGDSVVEGHDDDGKRWQVLRPQAYSVLSPQNNAASRVLCLDVLTMPSPPSNVKSTQSLSSPSSSPQRPSSTHVTFTASVPHGTTSYMVALGNESGQVSVLDANGGWPSVFQDCGLDHTIGSAVTGVLWATASPLVVERKVSSASSVPLPPLYIALLLTCGRDQHIHCSLVPLHGNCDAKRIATQPVGDLEDPTTLERLTTQHAVNDRCVYFASGHATGAVCLWRLSWASSSALAQLLQEYAEFEKLRVIQPTQSPATGIRCIAFLASSAMLLVAQGSIVERFHHPLRRDNASSSTKLPIMNAHQKSVRAICVSDSWIATGCFGGKVFVWDRTSVEEVTRTSLALIPSTGIQSVGTWVASLQFTSPHSHMTLLCIAAGTSLYVTDPRNGSLYRTIDFGKSAHMTDALRCFALLGPSRLVTGSFDGTVLYWSSEGGQRGDACHWCLRRWTDE